MSSSTIPSRFLAFSLGSEEYAIPLLSVKEVIALPEITPTPHSPPHFLGIMNLRGQVISVVDLRLKLGIKGKNSEEVSVIILDADGANLGVVVDSVNSVLNPVQEDLSDPPQVEPTKASEFITQVYRKEKHLVLILDAWKLLAKDQAVKPSGKVA